MKASINWNIFLPMLAIVVSILITTDESKSIKNSIFHIFSASLLKCPQGTSNGKKLFQKKKLTF